LFRNQAAAEWQVGFLEGLPQLVTDIARTQNSDPQTLEYLALHAGCP
jgi:hypothetical protein